MEKNLILLNLYLEQDYVKINNIKILIIIYILDYNLYFKL